MSFHLAENRKCSSLSYYAVLMEVLNVYQSTAKNNKVFYSWSHVCLKRGNAWSFFVIITYLWLQTNEFAAEHIVVKLGD